MTRKSSFPTKPDEVPLRTWRRAAWARRALVVLFCIPVVGSFFGLVGLTHADVRSNASGYELRARYPEISRAGIASPLDIFVHSEDGFDSPITLKITHEYYRLFDLNGIYPAPSAETVDGDLLVWEFDPPMEDSFQLHMDWRVQPSVHDGKAATVELYVDDLFIADVSFDTRIAP